jgi:CspA family cold shock protein
MNNIFSGQDGEKQAKDENASTKTNEEKQTGTVKWFNTAKGFGFIAPDDAEGDKDLFAHVNELAEGTNPNDLREDTRVKFKVAEGRKGPQAVDVELLKE